MKGKSSLVWLLTVAAVSLLAVVFPPPSWRAGEKAEKKAPPPKKDKKKDEFAGLKFRPIGPAAGGRVSRVCGVPGDRLTYYAATASGGVWKSTDGGFTWKSIFDDQPTASTGAVAVAPSDPNVVYVGSGEANIRGNVVTGNGIYKSTNGGKTWQHVWKQRGQISHIIVHPQNADIAYAAVLGSAFGPNPERGVYRTTDGGKSWKQVLKKDADTGAIDICFDPSNPRILFAALWQARRYPWGLTCGGPGSGLYRSDDGGDTWEQLGPQNGEASDENDDNGLPPGPYGRIGVAVGGNGKRVYALIEAEKGGLYRSDDGGAKWKRVNPHRYLQIRPWYFSVIRVDPTNPDVVWYCGLRLLKSIDGGLNFKKLNQPHHVDHHDLWIDPKDPQRMIDANDGGVDLTTNGGETWFAPPLPISQFYHISVDSSVPYRVMGNMQDLGTAAGPSNSLSRAGILLSHWRSVGGGETGHAVADPADPNVVYAGEYGGYLSRYDRRTRQARHIGIYPINNSGHGAGQLKYRFQWTAPLLISPHDPKVVYHAANVLFRTADGGRTWQAISPDLTRDDKSKQQWSGGPITGDNTGAEYYCTIFAIAESPKKAGVLWAGSDDGLVHVSTDGGKNWRNVTPKDAWPEWATVSCIEASPHDPAVAYVAVDNHRLDDDRPYLVKMSDYGQTWKALGAGLPKDSPLRVVREDPQVRGMLYVGNNHGVWLSRDDGTKWERLGLGLPTVPVSDLVVKDNDLVVGTQGRSIWILDDLTPWRQWDRIEKGDPYLFPVQPAVRWHYHGGDYTREERFKGDNPPQGAIVHYYLPQMPKGEITLEITDAKGQLVQKLSSTKVEPEHPQDHPDTPWRPFQPTVLPKNLGLNRVTWNLKHQGGRHIPGAKNDGGEPRNGPFVLPGRYTLTLTVDGQRLTQQVEVKMDPRVTDVSRSDLEESLRFALQVRDQLTRLADIVNQLREVRKHLTLQKEALLEKKDEPGVKKLDGLLQKLDALEAKLHNPKAEVVYDILAQKGGARLYSQMAALYEWVIDSDGPVTQGMREVFAEQSAELDQLAQEWQRLRKEIAAPPAPSAGSGKAAPSRKRLRSVPEAFSASGMSAANATRPAAAASARRR